MTAETLETLELDHGSGNVYRDLALPDPDLRQAKAVLAAAIIRALDERALTMREAAAATGFAAADFSRVRNARLARFTLDRLIRMLQALEPAARVSVQVDMPSPLTSPSAPASAPA
jgi:predicted XRE-type DNA-binding protein